MYNFQERFVEALRRRLYPNTTLHLKQLPAAIGRSESAVSNWRRGNHRIAAEDLISLASYFAARGDRTFLNEILPEALFNPPEKTQENELRSLLRSLLAALPENDGEPANLWATSEGAIVPAPLGHTEYVARVLRVPESVGNVVRYATGILGWIAISTSPKGVVTLRHDRRRIAPLAAESVCDWLRRRRAETRLIVRSIHVDGGWLDTQHDSVELAIEAISGAASIMQKQRRPWLVERLPLASITNSRLIRLLHIYREVPDQVVDRAAAIGALTDSSICSVQGDSVISLYVARKYFLSRQIVEGQDIMALPDTDYALMVRSRILAVKREDEPLYWELSGTLNNENLHYLNLAIPEPGSRGKVLTSSVILKRELL